MIQDKNFAPYLNQEEPSETPEVPETPEAPETPEVPETPEAPKEGGEEAGTEGEEK